MPRRSPLRRAATALLALLYLLAWGEPVALHPCPMHDGAGAASARAPSHGVAHDVAHGAAHAAAPVAHDAATADHATAGHAAVGHAAGPVVAVAPDGAPAPADEHGAGHACQCLGHGCCAAAVIAPAAQQARWFVVVTRRADPPADAAPPAPVRAAERLLPPATGPPVPG